MLDVVLVEPEIPGNTGNVIRLCANAGWRLHLCEPLGFSLEEKAVRRAGLDYHKEIVGKVQVHANLEQCFAEGVPEAVKAGRVFGFSARAEDSVFDVSLRPGDCLVFGSESKGLSQAAAQQFAAQRRLLRIPILRSTRSLNLANAVAIAGFEALRQNGFPGFT
ncbi:tRNA cytidine34-2'-O-methyltransferase [Hondaea fermentalgiana]|uniref:tRNA cytidine34-2'-O-methyltransferase n=1 Tax=Hondaea fermentalgiana TaxID=2315210 RepID=A0A2R5GFI1_9STRA|nr:tRNA cytidine34-2'-O-methyltransferase [Hondaea fermentalgiana]|eukprot:GBG26604.1 tRNA cytidine34-2'-O-methyltransferase [Hondaea fermentalgiana]